MATAHVEKWPAAAERPRGITRRRARPSGSQSGGSMLLPTSSRPRISSAFWRMSKRASRAAPPKSHDDVTVVRGADEGLRTEVMLGLSPQGRGHSPARAAPAFPESSDQEHLLTPVRTSDRHARTSACDASRVPSTRARILSNAMSRDVEASSANGAKPQSSVVPRASTGINRAASRVRSRTWSALSVVESIGSVTPTNTTCSGRRCSRIIPSTRSGSGSLANWT